MVLLVFLGKMIINNTDKVWCTFVCQAFMTIGKESVPKVIINDTRNIFCICCNYSYFV